MNEEVFKTSDVLIRCHSMRIKDEDGQRERFSKMRYCWWSWFTIEASAEKGAQSRTRYRNWVQIDSAGRGGDIDRTASLRSVYMAIQLTWFGKNPLDWRKDSRTVRDGHGRCSGGEWQSIATLDYAGGVKRTLGTGYLLVLEGGY